MINHRVTETQRPHTEDPKLGHDLKACASFCLLTAVNADFYIDDT